MEEYYQPKGLSETAEKSLSSIRERINSLLKDILEETNPTLQELKSHDSNIIEGYQAYKFNLDRTKDLQDSVADILEALEEEKQYSPDA